MNNGASLKTSIIGGLLAASYLRRERMGQGGGAAAPSLALGELNRRCGLRPQRTQAAAPTRAPFDNTQRAHGMHTHHKAFLMPINVIIIIIKLLAG